MEKKVINILTVDSFAFPTVGTYKFNTESGTVTITITERLSKYGSGHQTVFSGKWDGAKVGELVRKPIGVWKDKFGAVVNHRDGFTKSVKVLTDEQINKVVTDTESRLVGAVDALNKLIARIDENASLVSVDIASLCNTFRTTLMERNELAKVEKANAEKLNAEKAEKAERKELAKAVANFDDMQKELLKAINEKDFAKVAELTAKMQSA